MFVCVHEPLGEIECYSNHSTVMSKEDGKFGCHSMKDVGCTYHLDDSEQVYLIPYEIVKVRDINMNITNTGGKELNDKDIVDIRVWNMREGA